MKRLDIKYNLHVESVLGVDWCIQSDSFLFKITVKNKPLTRKEIVSTVSSIYDPFGIFSPAVLIAKKIVRDHIIPESVTM